MHFAAMMERRCDVRFPKQIARPRILFKIFSLRPMSCKLTTTSTSRWLFEPEVGLPVDAFGLAAVAIQDANLPAQALAKLVGFG